MYRVADAEAERLRLIQVQVEADLRMLVTLPAFRRMAAHWVRDAKLFRAPLGLPHDQLREWTGMAAMGRILWNDVTGVDPSFATDVLDLMADDTPNPTAP